MDIRLQDARHPLWRGLLSILLLFVVTTLATPGGAQTPFVHEIVTTGASAAGTSLDFDGDWDPHVIWMVPSGANLWDIFYAEQVEPDNWAVELVVTVNLIAANDETRPRLAVAEDGTPHIVYVDGFIPNPREVWHTAKIGGIWTPTLIEAVGFTGGYASIDVDPVGLAHIAYYNGATTDLRYAGEAFGFLPEIADGVTPTGQWTSVACDDPLSEIVQIAYYNQGLGDLWYSRRAPGGLWLPVSVDATGTTGQWTSIALDAGGNPHISYIDLTGGVLATTLKYATVDNVGAWALEFVDVLAGGVGFFSSIDLDQQGIPHISYTTLPGLLRYANRAGGVWANETVAGGGTGTSLKIGMHGNPAVAHIIGPDSRLTYSDSGVRLVAPLGGNDWPVASEREIRWRGVGPVNLMLSVDGGNTYDVVANNLFAGPDGSNGLHVLRVPNTPSRFCVVKVEREAPFSESDSDSFFTIEADVALLNFVVKIGDLGGGNVITWNTNPGPKDLAGYRLDRASHQDDWQMIVPLTKETRYVDGSGGVGDRYRLYAVNGLGQEFLMGEASGNTPTIDASRIVAWPQPFSAGELSIGFGTFGALGSPSADVTMDIYDVGGRLVRRLVNETFSAGTHVVKWDGRDESGVKAASGVYFIVSRSGQARTTRKIVLVR